LSCVARVIINFVALFDIYLLLINPTLYISFLRFLLADAS